jgi:hypothetical protein
VDDPGFAKVQQCLTSHGYRIVKNREHPRAMMNGYVFEHILLAEKALGKALPDNSEIHHSNGIKNDNSFGNLVICEGRGYHMLLHQRKRALAACGHTDWLRCAYCKQYDAKENMYTRKNVSQAWHRKCHAIHEGNRKNG